MAGPIKAEIAKTRQEIRAKDKVEEASNKLDKPPPTTKLPTQYAKANTVNSERSLEERVEQMCVSNAYLTRTYEGDNSGTDDNSARDHRSIMMMSNLGSVQPAYTCKANLEAAQAHIFNNRSDREVYMLSDGAADTTILGLSLIHI